MKKIITTFVAILLLSGCTTLKMEVAKEQNLPILAADKSRVVFMRSAGHGTVQDAGLYSVQDGNITFKGVIKNSTKMFLDVEPGKHTFMSNGFAARFIEANLSPGKTYYVIVAPRGWPGIFFALLPVSNDSEINLNSKSFKKMKSKTTLVEIGPKAIEWAEGQKELAQKNYEHEWPAWNSKPESAKSKHTIKREFGE